MYHHVMSNMLNDIRQMWVNRISMISVSVGQCEGKIGSAQELYLCTKFSFSAFQDPHYIKRGLFLEVVL